MKLLNLIWVLALAGAVAACNSGPPIQGCTVDPDLGDCVGSGPDPGPGGSGGAGGTAGSGGAVAQGCDPGTAEFTNACACCDGDVEVDPTCENDDSLVDCDYGCEALGNTFGFAVVLNADPAAGSGSFEVTFDGTAIISGAFIVGAEEALMADLNTADVNPSDDASLPVAALSGATGAVITLGMEVVIGLDLDADTDGDTEPGPYAIGVTPGTGTYTGTMGDEACFNYAATMTFQMVVTELDMGPTFIPANFVCQPANQIAINADPAVLNPEPTAGQVCLTIP